MMCRKRLMNIFMFSLVNRCCMMENKLLMNPD